MQKQHALMFSVRKSFLTILLFTIIVSGAFFFLEREILSFSIEDVKISIPKREEMVSLVFFGDAMFDRNVRTIGQNNGYDYLFKDSKKFIDDFDLAILNLEGVVTDFKSVSINSSILRFTFSPLVLKSIKNAGFDIVSHANNHTNDFGREGLAISRNNLDLENLRYFGDYFNESKFLGVEINGIRFAFVGFNEFSYNNFDKVLENIRQAKEDGYYVIVMPHWGTEYHREANSFQIKKAHQFIDNGADIIIGAHPHVVQNFEEYNSKPIFYSLGNFIFDQYFSKETQEGIALGLFVSNKKIEYKVFPFVSNKSIPKIDIEL